MNLWKLRIAIISTLIQITALWGVDYHRGMVPSSGSTFYGRELSAESSPTYWGKNLLVGRVKIFARGFQVGGIQRENARVAKYEADSYNALFAQNPDTLFKVEFKKFPKSSGIDYEYLVVEKVQSQETTKPLPPTPRPSYEASPFGGEKDSWYWEKPAYSLPPLPKKQTPEIAADRMERALRATPRYSLELFPYVNQLELSSASENEIDRFRSELKERYDLKFKRGEERWRTSAKDLLAKLESGKQTREEYLKKVEQKPLAYQEVAWTMQLFEYMQIVGDDYLKNSQIPSKIGEERVLVFVKRAVRLSLPLQSTEHLEHLCYNHLNDPTLALSQLSHMLIGAQILHDHQLSREEFVYLYNKLFRVTEYSPKEMDLSTPILLYESCFMER